MADLTADELLQNLAQRFEYHGANIYGSSDPHNNSPLYASLSLEVVRDSDILSLVMEADRATQVSNLLFGAVHYLLLQAPDHRLAAFYRSITEEPLPPDGAYPPFREFCLTHENEIRKLVTTRRIQTNEVGRCTGLLPAFEWVSQRAGRKPLALIEIGASAGLHMLWDQYGYEYQPGGKAGRSDAAVQLSCEVRAGNPLLPETMPEIVWRVGIDINPLDVNDVDAMLWLRALIWPEQMDRAAQLERAIAAAKANPQRIVAGNARDGITALIAEAPTDAYLVVLHSYTFNQMPADVFSEANESIRAASENRDLSRIALEWWGNEPAPTLDAYEYRAGVMERTRLAICESHGRWLEWQAG